MDNISKSQTTTVFEHQKESWSQKYLWLIILIFCEGLVMLFLGLFFTYGEITGPLTAKEADEKSTSSFQLYYPLFQDVHVMIFIGFGFLYTYLRSYSWTSVAYNFLVGAWVIQISILWLGFWECVCKNHWEEKIELDLTWLVNGDFAAASILISFGGVLGKFSLPQYMVMAFFETIFYCLNYRIGELLFRAIDAGGSMYIHTFGAYFGLAVTWIMFRKDNKCPNNPDNSSNFTSNIFAFIGTIFLWLYWPSFNGALVTGNARYRIIINTYLSLTGSCIMSFVWSGLLKNGRLHMEDILNASVAGGVIIGGCSDVIMYPWASLLIGMAAGSVSVLGFEKLSPFLAEKIGLFDTAGIHNLHGMPGFLGGIIIVIGAGSANADVWGDSLTMVFPALTERTTAQQAGYQLAALVLTLSMSITTGILTGLLLKSRIFYPVEVYYLDDPFWHTEEEMNLQDNQTKEVEIQSRRLENESQGPYQIESLKK